MRAPSHLSEERAQYCWALANSYLEAASRLRDMHSAEVFLPSIFLLLHALELHLKAFLISQGMSETQLRNIGHDLLACLRACKERGLPSHVTIAWVDLLQIGRLNMYYKRKELEYFVAKPKNFGRVDRLTKTIGQISKAVFNPVTAESFRALRRIGT